MAPGTCAVCATPGPKPKRSLAASGKAGASDLVTKIRLFFNGWNARAHPFVWTKTADHILQKADRPKNSTTER